MESIRKVTLNFGVGDIGNSLSFDSTNELTFDKFWIIDTGFHTFDDNIFYNDFSGRYKQGIQSFLMVDFSFFRRAFFLRLTKIGRISELLRKRKIYQEIAIIVHK